MQSQLKDIEDTRAAVHRDLEKVVNMTANVTRDLDLMNAEITNFETRLREVPETDPYNFTLPFDRAGSSATGPVKTVLYEEMLCSLQVKTGFKTTSDCWLSWNTSTTSGQR